MSEQAVESETDVTQSGVTEGADAQDDLDSLLAQFESETQETEQSDLSKDDLKEAVSYIKQSQEREWRERTQKDVENAVKSSQDILKEAGYEAPPSLIEGYLNLKAQKDPRVLNAFNQREKAPDAWAKVLNGVTRELVKELQTMPDREATANHDAVVSAVRSASTKSAEPEVKIDKDSLNRMTDREFSKLFKEVQRA